MKITKKQLKKIIQEEKKKLLQKLLKESLNESHPQRGVNFDITLDKAIQSDGHGTSDVITRDDFYEIPELDKMNIQQVAEFYDDMFHSPEYKDMKAGFDKEDQAASDAAMGHERDLSPMERSPKHQGMGRRTESINRIKKVVREILKDG